MNSTKLEEVFLGNYETDIWNRLDRLNREKVNSRIWSKDYTLWKPYPEEITNRLGWLNIQAEMKHELPRLEQWASQLKAAGFSRALLLGMGGSSLAPKMFSQIFGAKEGFLPLSVLDSTHPESILAAEKEAPLGETLFIVSTKSGKTLETLTFFYYFYQKLSAEIGKKAGEHFIAITDPGSYLQKLGEKYQFAHIFLNNPEIGGRYSALSYFGLVPAAILGLDLERLLDGAQAAAQVSQEWELNKNPAFLIGTFLGELARQGRDKATFLFAPSSLSSFGDWLEQLIAESTGKEGKGIVPVVTEPPGDASQYGEDRAFIFIEKGQEQLFDLKDSLKRAHQPFLSLRLTDFYSLGEQLFIWEMATAVAGHILGINPFDQPDVESTKIITREMIEKFKNRPSFEEEPPTVEEEQVKVWIDEPAGSLKEAVNKFLESLAPPEYLSIQAFCPYAHDIEAQLSELSLLLRNRYRVAVTYGYGPCFLHSTGQLHKGGRNQGRFIQLIAEPSVQLPLTGGEEGVSLPPSFGLLFQAQALGDRQALKQSQRRVLSLQSKLAPRLLIEKLKGEIEL